ncbi:MAG: hypothetical protein JSS30_01555 [Verrucomicrobia bacterium]|nr:hypothetical protein [Verrucomicrobiota bacterium]
MRTAESTSKPSPVNHIIGGIATAVGAGIFVKASGLWDLFSLINPINYIRSAPIDEAQKSAIEQAKATTAAAAEEAKKVFAELAEKATQATNDQTAAAAAKAAAEKAATDAAAALSTSEAAISGQDATLKAIVERCANEANSAATKISEFGVTKTGLSQALDTAKANLNNAAIALSGAEQAANSAAEAVQKAGVNATQVQISLANDLKSKIGSLQAAKAAAEEQLKTVTEQLTGFDTSVAQEQGIIAAAKQTCDQQINDATAQLNALQVNTPALTQAKDSAAEALKAATETFDAKAAVATAAETAKAEAEQKAAAAASEAARAASADTLIGRTREAGYQAWSGLKNRVSKVGETTKELILENKETLGAFFGFAATYYAVDFATSKHIKNPIARGAFSFTTAFVTVWTASNFVFKNEMAATTALMYGVSSIGGTLAAVKLAPFAQELASRTFNGAAWLKGRTVTYTRN